VRNLSIASAFLAASRDKEEATAGLKKLTSIRLNNPVKARTAKTPKSKIDMSKLKAAFCEVVKVKYEIAKFPFPASF
jgi:hypothetical protein